MQVLLLLFLTLFSSKILLGQSIDSLDIKLSDKYHKSIIKSMRSVQWKKAITYADSLYTLSKDRHNNQGVITALTLKGESYVKQGELSKAYQAYKENLLFMKKCNYKGISRGRLYKDLFILFSTQNKQDSAQKYKDIIFNLPCEKSTIIAKDAIAKRLLRSNHPIEALSWVNKNLACATALNETPMIIGSLSLISNFYQSIENYEKSLYYIDSMLKISTSNKDSLYILLSYDNLGILNTRLKNYSKAVDWFTKGARLAEKLYKKNGVYSHSKLVRTPIPIGIIYAHLASSYQNLDHQNKDYLDSINYYYQKALQIHYEQNDHYNIAFQLVNIAKIEKNYEVALDSLQKAYKIAPRHINWPFMQYHIFSTTGEAYTNLGQFKEAQFYLDSAETISHTLSDTTNQLMLIYELKRTLYLTQKDYKKAYTYETKATALYKHLQEKKEQKILTNFEIKYETEQIQQQNTLLTKERDIQGLKAEQNRQFAYAAGGGLLLVLIISILLIFQFRTKAVFLTQRLKYQLLRNQMNPHFIFNSLAAIQSFVYSKKPLEAGEYIASFAQLMRAILDNSHEEYVSLNKEIQWLDNYLKLQLLRFDNQFNYTLQLDPNIDTKETLIPPMLMQPFIENALEHGLKDIDYKGHLDININAHNNLLQIDILDNGIGLEQSKQNNKDKTHESRATQITQERLDFLNKKQAQNIHLSITPNKDKGTKVSFAIPLIAHF